RPASGLRTTRNVPLPHRLPFGAGAGSVTDPCQKNYPTLSQAPACSAIGGYFRCQSVFRSNASATRKTVASSNGLPIICSPIGILPGERPQGSEAAGRPERFSGAQNRADTAKTDSSLLPIRDVDCPIFNAVVGWVGVSMTSTLRRASRNADLMAKRARCALM